MELYTTPNVQDRTFEFQQCVNTFAKQEKRYIPPTQQPQQQQKNNSNISKTEFSKNASVIAKDIARVTGSLSKLAQLAKRKQLFNDKPTDIIELTYIIKQDIFRIEKSLKSLQQQTGSQSSSSSGSSESQINTYNKNVVQLLNTKTKNISETFKEVLQTRQRNELQQRTRQEQLLAAVANTENANSMNNNNNSEIPYAVRSANKKNNGIRATNSENPFLATLNTGDVADDNNNSMLSIPDQSQQMMLLEEQNNRYVQERSNAVEAIESTINEVGGLFQQLATMVQEQGEVIQRIDDNVEDVSLNISGAQRELMKYYNTVSSNRWLMLKIFGVLIVFFLLWVLVS